MKKFYFLLVALCFFVSSNAQIINFPDANFKAKLLMSSSVRNIAKNLSGINFKIDANNNGEIEENEALNVGELNVSAMNFTSSPILEMTGIEYFKNITFLNCSNIRLITLSVIQNTHLKKLYCSTNNLTSLDVTQNTALQELFCDSNQFTSLNVTQNRALQLLNCDSNPFTSLNVTQNPALQSFFCRNNQLASLDVTQNSALKDLFCSNNQLTTLDLTQNAILFNLSCDINQLASLDVTQNPNLYTLNCMTNQLTSLDVTQNPALKDLFCSTNQLTSLNVTQNPDLNILYCYNNQLTSLNVVQNPVLRNLYCYNNQLTSLNFMQNPILAFLECQYNQLTSLDFTSNPSLEGLYCNNNQLNSLNVTQNPGLFQLTCQNNQLTSLNLTQNPNLMQLDCQYNQLASLDVRPNQNLYVLNCFNNQIISLDLSANTSLNYLNCSNNLLQSLFIKNNSVEIDIDSNSNDLPIFTFENLPNLQYICADEFQIADIQNKITSYGYTNCHVNSYCTFTPGGTFYTIQGNNKFDANNNGCNDLDNPLPNLKYTITDGTNSTSLISNTTGNHSIPVQAGTQTITPVFENLTYFTISPANVVVDFPTQASPFTQDFCVTANGLHPDLEVFMLPIIPARPGFDAVYKLIYKNKGNTTQSGTVNLNFTDAVLDFVTAIPAVTTQTANNLSWNFANLTSFETREITFTLNANSALETPAVNEGDILNYTATLTSAATDDMPNDNTFTYNQTVVNSFDPNDITCLEGTIVGIDKIGEYVHYMIRFENNGTANAQNIVVKNMVDLAKFDINSIVPIKGSHSFVTKLTSGNKVEFIFENINLPFDDANNDGYVSFKIKTKSDLVAGDTFAKNVNIYFDYNFPIVTNTAMTVIAALSVQDFVFSNYFNLYPNPTKNTLNIAVKEIIEISSINIYNTLGQLVLVIPNAQNTKTVDVSSLTAGNYFIKINSDKGTSNTQFVKQ